ncbi:AAA family ATPase [Fimbriiglobus ruber]|uniref:OmpA domain protein n=1 Tax=Fimbriiglobus ruber TaxID=1908690 RepID=A0A225DCP4_9BACT|nr:AAA family ATPase [Fimbriiglobus ruber]OWK34899.1 OmpA domain protein [Fimbriiglobus ruber]
MFLSRVAISDFRTFPIDFSLELTPGPGVTLIVGQNGLGKSTFFEALEWCLTGQVKRLSDLPTEGSKKADFLARRLPDGKEAAKYGVELTFQPQAAVKFARWREKDGTAFKATIDPSESDLISALKAPTWKEPILALGSYLRLTHFLSQAGEQRFAVQDSKDRWSALEAPAGTERLNRLRERLGNRGVTSAFNRRAKEAQDAINNAEQAVKNWDELIERRNHARRIAESGGAVSQAELLPQLEMLRVDIAGHFGDFQFTEPSSPEACIRQIATRLDGLRPSLAGRVEAAKSLEPAPRQWRQAMDDIAKGNAVQSARQTQVVDATMTIDRLQFQIAEEDGHLKQVDASLEEIARGRSRLTRIATARSSLEELLIRERALAERISLAEVELARVSATARNLFTLADDQRRLEREYASATDRSEAVRELQNLYTRFLRAEGDAKDADSKLSDIRLQTQGIDKEVQEIERDRLRHTQSLHDCDQRLQRLRFQATTIESCVASLASVITEEDTHCPLCSTEFAAGELKKLVNAAASTSNDGLSAAEAAIENVREAIRLVEERAAIVASKQLQRDRASKNAAAARATADALQATLRLHQFIASSPAGIAIENRVATLQAAAKMRLDELTSSLRGSISAAERDKTATDAEVNKRSAESTLHELKEELAALRISRQEYEAILEPASQIGDDTARLSSELAKLAESEGSLLTTQEARSKKLAALSVQLRAAVTTRQSLESELLSASHHASELQRLLDILRISWNKSGFKGDPSAEALQLGLDEIAERQKRLAEFEARNRTLLEGHSSWSKAEEFGNLQKQITETVQHLECSSEEGARPALDRALGAARAQAQQATDARLFRDQMIDKLGAEARQYANKVLAPLNSLNESFLRVFSCFSNLSVSMGAKTQQTSVKLEFVLRWLAGSAESGTAASIRHFLSEGQLSALSVSLLLSMSTAYRWSQWRALILDDPLQHNDVIHATSFIEVLRNLVRYQGYQVLLSTHDLELADFIRRKMEAAEVDCKTCQFLGTRQTGVKYKVT